MFSIVGFPLMFISLFYIKDAILNDTLFTNITASVYSAAMILPSLFLYLKPMKHNQGYTTVTTTQYNLFKCRESGKDETFMMFADTEDELEMFFSITAPDKKFFIEPAEMSGKSIKMRIFNGDT
jgi:hypothetical protein